MTNHQHLKGLVFFLAPLLLIFTACNGDNGDGDDTTTDPDVQPDTVDDDAQVDPLPDPQDDPDGVTDVREDDITVPDTLDAEDIPADEIGDPGPDARACAGCGPENACLMVEVTRAEDDSFQPWVLWPDDADGIGTLIAHAVRESAVLARETLAGADMTPESASYAINMCVTPGTVEVIVFLDDDEDVRPDTIYSADYLDSCMGLNGECYRCVELAATTGEDIDVTAELVSSCD